MALQVWLLLLMSIAIAVSKGLECGSDRLPCANGQECIPARMFCDGFRHCPDRSDEYRLNAVMDPGENFTRCRGRKGHICVVAKSILPRISGSCSEDLQCKSNEFPCEDGSGCFRASWLCDGIRQCSDGSDEYRPNAVMDPGENFTRCRGRDGHICVVAKSILTRVNGSCSTDLQCKSNEFPCEDGSGCFRASWFCDGNRQCSDGSDEYRPNAVMDRSENFTRCRSRYGYICVVAKSVLPRVNGSCSADLQCKSSEFSCEDGSGCFRANQFCDGRRLCSNGSDEYRLNAVMDPGENFTRCRGRDGHICVVAESILPRVNGYCSADWQCKSNEFQCVDGSRCVLASWFCDGYRNCPDGSDEATRLRTSTYDVKDTFYYSNDSSQLCVLPAKGSSLREKICQNNTSCHCRNFEKYYVDDACFRCLSSPNYVLSISQLCDGIFDCPDVSDECLCPIDTRRGICHNMTFDKYLSAKQPRLVCSSSNKTSFVDTTKLCDGKNDCFGGDDEMICKENDLKGSFKDKAYKCPFENKDARQCDGIPECRYFTIEECRCSSNAGFCDHLNIGSTSAWINNTWVPIAVCPSDRSKDVFNHHLCDGKARCPNKADERGCNETRFYCRDDSPLPNIPIRNRCDRYDDCDNEADEKNCSHFYCNDNGTVKYLQPHYKCDGFKDCDSGIDECVCVKSAFSDDVSMVSNKGVLAMVWIISLAALGGCVAVVIITVRDLLQTYKDKTRKISGHITLNKLMILSLSASDLLVALYTLAICIKAIEFNQDYCESDRKWRSSGICSGLGVLLMIGSEQSVFTMLLIAVARFLSVKRPFSKPNIRGAMIILSATWLISVLLGVIPLIGSAEDYFVKSVLFNQNPLFKIVYQNDTEYLIDWLSLMRRDDNITEDGYGSTDWSKFKNRAVEVHPNMTVLYEYGYYSSHTVCLPTFFPDRLEDRAWGYTLFLLVVNLIAFLSMLIIYMILYKHTVKQQPAAQSDAFNERRRVQNAKMQRKLTRIIVTDFLCWAPICIMGFLQIIGIPIPDDAYVPAGLLIIPINSALNPLLYSDIPDILIEKLKAGKEMICPPSRNEEEVIAMRAVAL